MQALGAIKRELFGMILDFFARNIDGSDDGSEEKWITVDSFYLVMKIWRKRKEAGHLALS